LGGLSIADDSDHGYLQCNYRRQKLFQAFFRPLDDIFCIEDSSRQDITKQIDRFIALIWLNAINGEHDPFIFADLLFAAFIMADFRPCAQQRGVGFKEKQDFSARDRLVERG